MQGVNAMHQRHVVSSWNQRNRPSRAQRVVTLGVVLLVGLLAYRHFWPSGPAYQVTQVAVKEGLRPEDLTDVDGTLYFTADDDTHGRELWTSDGTSAGTFMLKDVQPNRKGWVGWIGQPVAVGATVYFVDYDDAHGYELWKTDGSQAGTVMVKDLRPGPAGSKPSQLVDAGGMLLFVATDGLHGGLWTSDGTAAGTVPVDDIWLGGKGSWDRRAYEAEPWDLTVAGGTTFFSADDGRHGRELWRSDGTSDGTVFLKDLVGGSAADRRTMTAIGGTLFFRIRGHGAGDQLWRSDGTPAGTTLVRVINPGVPDSHVSSLTDVAGILYSPPRGRRGASSCGEVMAPRRGRFW